MFILVFSVTFYRYVDLFELPSQNHMHYVIVHMLNSQQKVGFEILMRANAPRTIQRL